MDVFQYMGCKELDMTEQLNWTELNHNWTEHSYNSKLCFSIHSFLGIKTMYNSMQDNMKKKIFCP